MTRKTFRIILALAVLVTAVSCGTTNTYKKIDYIQDVPADSTWVTLANDGILIQPKDQISIIVSSSQAELTAMFNLPVVSYQAGSEMSSTGYSNQRLVGYSVDNEGCIDFPVVGKIKVSGMNRWQLSDKIKNILIDNKYLKDPVVSVEFMNFKISVIGEVTNPGTYTINGDKITILQALSLARDMTIYGRRDDVMVVREQNGSRNIYHIDVRSKDMFDSPAYYLQQNDVVYVYPNAVRAGQSTINENYFKSGSFWISLGSITMTLANLIISLLR